MIKSNLFIELPDFQKTIYWLGIPYMVESSFRGRFMSVRNNDDTELSYSDSCLLEGDILMKYNVLKKVDLTIKE